MAWNESSPGFYNHPKFNVPENIRVYLHVPYEDKEDAKSLGCRWDPEKKKWYCIDNDHGKSNITECLKRRPDPAPYKLINGEKVVVSSIPKNERGWAK
jgi:hypothetical protein